MNAIALLLATSAVGVDVGWQPAEGGGLEYIIQIEPQLLEVLKNGKDLTSEVPPGLNVRRYRITVGSAALPQQGERPPAAAIAAEPPFPPAKKEAPAEMQPEAPRGNPLDPGTSSDQDKGRFNFPFSTPRQDSDKTDVPPAKKEPTAAPDFGRSAADAAASPPGPSSSTEPNLLEASHTQPIAPASQSDIKDPGSGKSAVQDRNKPVLPAETYPWPSLVATLFALFTSLGGNAFLGWFALGERAKYRRLAEEFHALPAEN